MPWTPAGLLYLKLEWPALVFQPTPVPGSKAPPGMVTSRMGARRVLRRDGDADPLGDGVDRRRGRHVREGAPEAETIVARRGVELRELQLRPAREHGHDVGAGIAGIPEAVPVAVGLRGVGDRRTVVAAVPDAIPVG